MSAGCTHPLRQANGASVVLMAALTQLTEEAATQKPKAEATQLRPLPFLLYLADGDTARRAPRPLRAAPARPHRARAAPAPRPRRAHRAAPPSEPGAGQLQRLRQRRGAQARDESLQALPRGRLLAAAGHGRP